MSLASQQLADQRAQVEAAFQRNAKALPSAQEAMEDMAERTKMEINKREIERRRRLLLRQRELLLAKKRSQRVKQLQRFEKEPLPKRPMAASRVKSRAPFGNSSSGASSRPAAAASDDLKRQEMRLALCRRLKHDVIINSQRRLEAKQAEHRRTLSEQLQTLDNMVDTRNEEEMDMIQKLREAQRR